MKGTIALALLACGCYSVKPPPGAELATFAVSAGGVYVPKSAAGPRRLLEVVSRCASKFGGEALVPLTERGTIECPYGIPRGEVELEATATALGRGNEVLADFFGPVSFRAVPGDLTGDYDFRWSNARTGVANGVIKVAHLFGEVRVWAEDAPPQLAFASGQLSGTIGEVMRIDAASAEIYRSEDELRVAYFFDQHLVFHLSVSLKGVALSNGVRISLPGDAEPNLPRATVTRRVFGEEDWDFPRIGKGELQLTTGANPVEMLTGSFTLTFADDPSKPKLSRRTAAGTFNGWNGTREHLPVEPERRTYATGLSPVLYFEEPTLAKVQIPDGFDNRSSPLVGQFLTIGKNPESGSVLVQSCSDDPANDGKPLLMVVTGTDPSGFFVTDLSACRQVEQTVDPATGSTVVRVAEPQEACVAEAQGPKCAVSRKSCATSADCLGYLPGTYGSMFIYNYSFPDGLDSGDLLFTLSGSVQEFTSTTQLTFPAWSIAEKVRMLPYDQWDKWLKLLKPVELNLRHCGLDSNPVPFVTDTLCGHNRRNLKMESLESALVVARRLKFPDVFHNCDKDGDSEVPFFCESKFTPSGCNDACGGTTPYCNPTGSRCQSAEWGWRDCSFGSTPPGETETAETICNIECVNGQGQFDGRLCTERSTFVTYGQFIAEMAGPGPAEAGLDESIPSRMQQVPVGLASVTIPSGYAPLARVNVWCDAAVRMAAGDGNVVATASDTPIPKGTVTEVAFKGAQTHLAFIADGDPGPSARCVVAQKTHTRINIVTKDAVPELVPDCRTDDQNADRAAACQALRAATFDVTGHLRHLQPGRPRWVILPRDADDICCHPGPGLSCPRPIKPCQ
ncbi:MAG: hypothetical protein HYZ28_21940 [Myxococcales bacterium]|nr:hypothetical protein [Myxococcales bacterium]